MVNKIFEKKGPAEGAEPQNANTDVGNDNDTEKPVPVQAKSFAKAVEDAKGDHKAPNILGGGPAGPPKTPASPKPRKPAETAPPIEEAVQTRRTC
jgi:hypothetical protein